MSKAPTPEQLCTRLGVSPFAAQMVLGWITKPAAAGECARLEAWMDQLASPERAARPLSAWQRGCPEVIPGLRAEAVWFAASAWRVAEAPVDLVGFVAALEHNFEAIRDEVLGLRGLDAFQEYRSPAWGAVAAGEGPDEARAAGAGPVSAPPPNLRPLGVTATSAGSWSVAYLDLHNASEELCAETRARCPRTAALLRGAPRPYGHALLSALAPGSHIRPHVGSTNKKLRVHLPLVVPGREGDCTLTVGGEALPLRAGSALVFDDSFLHEARAAHAPPGSGPARLTLIVDVWHPDLSASEVRALAFLRNAALRQARLLSEGGGVPAGADFYAVLEDARQRRGGSDGVVFGRGEAELAEVGSAAGGSAEDGGRLPQVEVRDD